MLLIVQIAIGVCVGLVLFRALSRTPVHRPQWDATRVIAFLAAAGIAFWVLNLARAWH